MWTSPSSHLPLSNAVWMVYSSCAAVAGGGAANALGAPLLHLHWRPRDHRADGGRRTAYTWLLRGRVGSSLLPDTLCVHICVP